MARKGALTILVFAAGLSMFTAACQDTKTLQENEQLKTRVADLQKQVGELGNNLETTTVDRDALKKENETLKAELSAKKGKKAKKKVSAKKRHRA